MIAVMTDFKDVGDWATSRFWTATFTVLTFQLSLLRGKVRRLLLNLRDITGPTTQRQQSINADDAYAKHPVPTTKQSTGPVSHQPGRTGKGKLKPIHHRGQLVNELFLCLIVYRVLLMINECIGLPGYHNGSRVAVRPTVKLKVHDCIIGCCFSWQRIVKAIN